MPLIRVTSIMLIITGLAVLILGLIHIWAGFGFFHDEYKLELGSWWATFIFMFFSAGLGVLLAGGILVNSGTVIIKQKSASLFPVVLTTLYLMLVSTLSIVMMPGNIFSWLLTTVTIFVTVALVFGFAAVRALERRKKQAIERQTQSDTGISDLIE